MRYGHVSNIMSYHSVLDKINLEETPVINYPATDFTSDDAVTYFITDNQVRDDINDVLETRMKILIERNVVELKKIIKELEELEKEIIELGYQQYIPLYEETINREFAPLEHFVIKNYL